MPGFAMDRSESSSQDLLRIVLERDMEGLVILFLLV